MTTRRDSGALPGHHELGAVCGALGLDPLGVRMLPSRSNAVFHLPTEAIVVRLSSATPTNEARAVRVVSLTSWIADHGGPALAPTPHPQPVREADTVATLWPYLSSPGVPRAQDLAGVVRDLHHLDAQPPLLPEHQPLARLHEALDLDTARDQPVLSADTRGGSSPMPYGSNAPTTRPRPHSMRPRSCRFPARQQAGAGSSTPAIHRDIATVCTTRDRLMVRLSLDYQIHILRSLRRSPVTASGGAACGQIPREATPRPQGARAREMMAATPKISSMKLSDRRPHGLSLQRDHDRLKEWSRAAARSAWALVSLSGMSRGTPRDRYSVEYI